MRRQGAMGRASDIVRDLARGSIEVAYWRLAHLRRRAAPFDADMEPAFHDAYLASHRYTMTRVERMYALWLATRYVVEAGVPGAIVECGVWRGGSMMLVATALRQLAVSDRHLYLMDTFEGMPQPTSRDLPLTSRLSSSRLWARGRRADHNEWLFAGIAEVQANMGRTGYASDRVHLVKGRVEDTLPESGPDSIALLRLDTDFYDSTLHELRTLFPRLSPGGVLILDDYGYWRGAKEAADQYFRETGVRLLLLKVDIEGRVAIKVA